MSTFYTYLWFRKDWTPYYVGKGRGNRAFYSCKKHRPPKDGEKIIIQYWPSEEVAFATEVDLIRKYGRKDLGAGCLRNMSNGGIGGALTGKPLERMKAALTGKKLSAEHKARIGKSLRKPKSSQHRLKIKTICAPAGGRAAGRLAVTSGQINTIWNLPQTVAARRKSGTIQGRINANSGHMPEIAHIRWHVNRNMANSSCLYCNGEQL
jgi:hypothetical protein